MISRSHFNHGRHASLTLAASFVLIPVLGVAQARAGSATWGTSPATGDWNTATNWTPSTVPNSPRDTATFATSSTTEVALSSPVTLRAIVFGPSASTFSLTLPLRTSLSFAGTGITNNSTGEESFHLVGGTATFSKAASAGANSSFVIESPNQGKVGHVDFIQRSSAGSSTFTNTPGVIKRTNPGGLTRFFGTATAGTATFINNGNSDASPGLAGSTQFYETSTADHGVFQNVNATAYIGMGGTTEFFDNSTAAEATFTSVGVGGYAGGVIFHDDSTAADSTYVGSDDPDVRGYISFTDNATAANATINLSPGHGAGFYDNSTADHAIITLEAPETVAFGAAAQFYGNSTAPEATFILEGGMPGAYQGGSMLITESASVGNSTFILEPGVTGAPGGRITFLASANSTTARFELMGSSTLDIGYIGDDGHGSLGLTAGSIEGTGNIYLGANNLTVGTNNLSTTFAGSITDSSSANLPGTLTKVGTGTLLLTGFNPLGGLTLVSSGTLGGTGSVLGPLTIGTGSGGGASFAPGVNGTGTFNAFKTLTIASDGTYLCELNSSKGKADLLAGTGVILSPGATTSLTDLGNTVLAAGTSLIILHDSGRTGIVGTFSNLPDLSNVTVGPNTYQVKYNSGSQKIDLTLTVQ